MQAAAGRLLCDEKGWATMPGTKEGNAFVASACAEKIAI
jgi:hypothetical protein